MSGQLMTTQYRRILRLFMSVCGASAIRCDWLGAAALLSVMLGGCQHIQTANSPMPVFAPSQVQARQVPAPYPLIKKKPIRARPWSDGQSASGGTASAAVNDNDTQRLRDFDKGYKLSRLQKSAQFDDKFFILEDWF